MALLDFLNKKKEDEPSIAPVLPNDIYAQELWTLLIPLHPQH